MSQENVKLVLQRFSSRPEPAGAEVVSFETRKEAARHMIKMQLGGDAIGDWWAKPEEIEGAGDKVYLHERVRCRGQKSGIVVEFYDYDVWTFREGQVINVEHFDERDRARNAAGLR